MDVGGLGFTTLVKGVLTPDGRAYLLSATDVDGKLEMSVWRMKGRFYYTDQDEFLSTLLDEWGEAVRFPLIKAVRMRLVSIDELKDVITRIRR